MKAGRNEITSYVAHNFKENIKLQLISAPVSGIVRVFIILNILLPLSLLCLFLLYSYGYLCLECLYSRQQAQKRFYNFHTFFRVLSTLTEAFQDYTHSLSLSSHLSLSLTKSLSICVSLRFYVFPNFTVQQKRNERGGF